MNGIDQLAEGICALRSHDPYISEQIAFHVADTAGALVAATATAEGKAVIAFHRELQSLAGAGGADPLNDIALQCALARLSEADDIHLASMMTPGAIVIPTAFILAARLDTAGAPEVAAAILAGYEAMIRLGRAIDGPAVLYRGIWPTYFAAAFGTAAVGARLLRLTARETAHALAAALTMSAPAVGQHHAATTARWLCVGQAARKGVTAALAARCGFTADLDLLRSQFLPGVYGIAPDLAALTDATAEQPAFAEVSFKPWCAARQTMAATQAFREGLENGIAVDEITAITAAVLPPHLKMIDHGVKEGDRASFMTSLPYQMALAVLQPQAQFALSTPSTTLSPALQSLMSRITVIADDSLLAHYPAEWPARVLIVTARGRHEILIRHVPGDPGRRMDEPSLKHKFDRLTAPVLGEHSEELWRVAVEALVSAECSRKLMRQMARIIEQVTECRPMA
ncbi:MAG: MmgE/PrpD family protein [Xanthobacteraceae bacterium]|nr:MmgE/PrpD family protein [Xanthobacteraceae bacterium]